MSETVSRDQQVPGGEQSVPGQGAEPPELRRGRSLRVGWVALGIAAVIAAAALGSWRAGVFSPARSSGAGQQGPPATAVVTRQDLSATTPVTATLGYAGSYTVTGQGGGTLTWLPPAGKLIRQGQVLYRIGNGSPVVLLYGRVPAWRDMAEGITGADVTQLNHDLVKLGYADRASIAAVGWDFYSSETAYAVRLLEEHLGVSFPPGSLSLGQVVFKPVGLRVSRVTGSLGGPASGPVLTATSDRDVVMIPLDASLQTEVKAGDKVSVTLPDGTNTPGVVSSIGKVATTTPSGQGQGPSTTIPVQVTLTDPRAAGTLDQAPVTVNIVTATVHDVLAVPVTALVARSPSAYDVEVVGPGGTRRYVPVTVGPVFDDLDGLVQVTGALAPGQRVVVPAS